ncbi:hypothetical protein DFH09DRAFT_1177846 [Mycena vulgaris]|nr:hypothetical protein DFH09DRAFT_1177846 [Mycena vulgaris]
MTLRRGRMRRMCASRSSHSESSRSSPLHLQPTRDAPPTMFRISPQTNHMKSLHAGSSSPLPPRAPGQSIGGANLGGGRTKRTVRAARGGGRSRIVQDEGRVHEDVRAEGEGEAGSSGIGTSGKTSELCFRCVRRPAGRVGRAGRLKRRFRGVCAAEASEGALHRTSKEGKGRTMIMSTARTFLLLLIFVGGEDGACEWDAEPEDVAEEVDVAEDVDDEEDVEDVEEEDEARRARGRGHSETSSTSASSAAVCLGVRANEGRRIGVDRLFAVAGRGIVVGVVLVVVGAMVREGENEGGIGSLFIQPTE